jgi:hypothetical protein
MAKKKNQNRNKGRSQQARQKHELKRRQKKKGLSAQKPQAVNNPPLANDLAMDEAYLESLSPEVRAQLEAVEASGIRPLSAIKTNAPNFEQPSFYQSTLSEKEKKEHPIQRWDAPTRQLPPEAPKALHDASDILDFRGIFHVSMFGSKRLERFVISLKAVMDELGHDRRGFNMYDVKERPNRIFLVNLVRRKVNKDYIESWQKALLAQVDFDWSIHPGNSPYRSRFGIALSRKLDEGREKISFTVAGESEQRVIFLDLWEAKLKHFEKLQKTLPKVDSVVLRKEGLINWITETRMAHSAGALPERFVARLKAANFDLKPYQKRSKKAIDSRFEDYCKQTAAVQKQFATTWILPKMDRKLHLWINKQRWLYRNGNLSSEHTAALKRLGLLDKPSSKEIIEVNWLKNYRAIKDLLETTADKNLPPIQRLELRQKQWIQSQKIKHRAGKLKPDHAALLQEIGML